MRNGERRTATVGPKTADGRRLKRLRRTVPLVSREPIRRASRGGSQRLDSFEVWLRSDRRRKEMLARAARGSREGVAKFVGTFHMPSAACQSDFAFEWGDLPHRVHPVQRFPIVSIQRTAHGMCLRLSLAEVLASANNPADERMNRGITRAD